MGEPLLNVLLLCLVLPLGVGFEEVSEGKMGPNFLELSNHVDEMVFISDSELFVRKQ